MYLDGGAVVSETERRVSHVSFNTLSIVVYKIKTVAVTHMQWYPMHLSVHSQQSDLARHCS